MKTLISAAALTLATAALAQPPRAARAGAADAGVSANGPSTSAGVRVAMQDAQGKSVGHVTLEHTHAGILMRGDLSGLPPGAHAIHVHEVGQCQPPFTTAGAHYNPTKREHGLMNEKGHHAGDLPNITVGADGRAQFEALSADLTLGKGRASVMDKDGSSVVVHAKADDHTTGPSGNAGDRIACGVIEAAKR